MNTLTGIPFKNMINKQILVANEQTLKIIYPEQVVTILATGWGDYHVIVEEGTTRESIYNLMSDDMVNDKFDINIKEY
jgi:hypothetical protein